MQINIYEILDFDPKSKCNITCTFTEEWKHCHYQMKNKDAPELNPNDLPVLDDEYIVGDTGEPLLNDNNEEVYDPKQEILYDRYVPFSKTEYLTSDTLIGLIQEKVKSLIEKELLSEDFEDYEFIEACDVDDGREAIYDFLSKMGCTDQKWLKEEDDYDDLLWCTSSQLDEEQYEIYIEERKGFAKDNFDKIINLD